MLQFDETNRIYDLYRYCNKIKNKITHSCGAEENDFIRLKLTFGCQWAWIGWRGPQPLPFGIKSKNEKHLK